MGFVPSEQPFSRWLVISFLFSIPCALGLVGKTLSVGWPDFMMPIFFPLIGGILVPAVGIKMAVAGLIEVRALPGEYRGEWMGWFALTVFLLWTAGALAVPSLLISRGRRSFRPPPPRPQYSPAIRPIPVRAHGDSGGGSWRRPADRRRAVRWGSGSTAPGSR
jgi:hypothetical protein